MNWEYHTSYDQCDIEAIQTQMFKVKEEALSKLSDLEISAIFENLHDFSLFYREELEDQYIQHRIY